MRLLSRLTVANKIGVFILVSFFLLLLYFVYNLNSNNSNHYNSLRNEKQTIISAGIEQKLAQQFNGLAIGLAPIIENQAIIAAFAARDRELLEELTLASMEHLHKTGIRQYQFHMPNADSFYRVHKPEAFGDSLAAFRHTVVAANNERKTIMGLEGGVAGAGFRYVVPLNSITGSHIGTVELGMGLTSSFLKSLQLEYGGDWDFYSLAEDNSNTLIHLAGLNADIEKPDLTIANNIANNLVQHQSQIIENGAIDQFLFPLVDFSDVTRWALVQTVDNSALISDLRSALITNLIVSIVIILLIVIVLTLLVKWLLAPIGALTEVANKVARDDLVFEDLQITTSYELTALGNSFNEMNRKIKCLVDTLKQKNNQLKQSAEQLKQNADQTIDAASLTADAINEVSNSAEIQMNSTRETATAMEEMAIGIGRVAETSSQVTESSMEMRNKAQIGNESVQKTISNISDIKSSVNDSSEIINELKSDSEKIGGIVKIISDISEQTNLLALNAAIEAARAGDAGRGFAVVADEIRKLADQTSKSTNQINDIIVQIQDKTSRASVAMDSSQSQVEKGIEVFEQVNSIFADILSSVESVAAQIEDLSAISEQMSAGSEEVTASVQELSGTADKTAERTNEISDLAKQQMSAMEDIVKLSDELNTIADDLQESVCNYKVK